MTELLFTTDAYLKDFEAKVLDTDSETNSLILEATAFYPGGGGQPCDYGIISFEGNDQPVIKVKKIQDEVWHTIEGELPETGSTVQCSIDWERRYRLMRTHSALHVLCGVIWRDYQALVTGGNMEPLSGRLDFEFETMPKELIEEIQINIIKEVAAERDIIIDILPREEAFKIPDLIRTKINLLPEGIRNVRTVHIAGLDLQADGGTHVRNTREIGEICIAGYKSKGRINKRIMIELAP